MVRSVRRRPRHLAAVLVAAVAVAQLVLVPAVRQATPAEAAAPHPRLLFDAAGASALRARVAAGGIPGAAYARLRAKADGYLTPGSPTYIDPLLVMSNPFNGCRYYDNDGDGQLDGGDTKVCGASLKYYDGLFGQNQMSTALIELGLAYQLSGLTKYADRAVLVLNALADHDWPAWACDWTLDDDPGFAGVCHLGIGDLMAGVGLAFDMTYDRMTAAQRLNIVTTLSDQNNRIFDILTDTRASSAKPQSNWMGVSAGGIGLTLLAIEGELGAPADIATRIGQAHSRVELFLNNGFAASGNPAEGYVYGNYGLKNALPYAIAARRNGRTDVLTNSNASRVARWLAYQLLPGMGHVTVPLGDSGGVYGSPGPLAMSFAAAPTDGVVQWVWQRTAGPLGDDFYNRPNLPFLVNTDCVQEVAPTTAGYCPLGDAADDVWHILWWKSPAELPEVSPATVGGPSKHFEPHGLVVARTGFGQGENELVSTFFANRKAHGHGQYDLGSFTLYGYGAHFAIDSAYACAVCGDNHESGQAAGHNVVLIDENIRTMSPEPWKQTGTTVDDHRDLGAMAYSHADLKNAYHGVPTAIAEREHLLVRPGGGRPAILAVTDHINRDGNPHNYRWQLHTDAQNIASSDGSGFDVEALNGARMVGLTTAAGTTVDMRERISQQKNFAEIHPYHRVLYNDAYGRVDYDHLAVMAATPAGVAAPTLRTVSVPNATAIAVDSAGGTDLIVSKVRTATMSVGPDLTFDGTFGRVAVNGGESLLRNGTALTYLGVPYVSVTGSAATVLVSGNRAEATGAAGNVYRVHAPQSVTTTVNGVLVDQCRTGNVVLFPC